MKTFLPVLALLLAVGCATRPGATPKAPASPWELTWSDEFNGPDGSRPDPTKWVMETGGGGWGNQELETYTTRPQNSVIRHGELVITALKEDFTGPDQIRREYTSARMKTLGLFSQAYGRFEARIKIPYGQGIWPAFWMMGDNIQKVGWPTCGEIDIMENIGREPGIVHGTLHGPGYSGAKGLGADSLIAKGRYADDYHVYAVEWEPNEIRFYVDATCFVTRRPSDLPPGGTWVYDHPHYLLLNLAVGGGWPGNPDATTTLPQEMHVDYVRVYRRK